MFAVLLLPESKTGMFPNISLNRRMPNGTSGGVRGARFSSPYSIFSGIRSAELDDFVKAGHAANRAFIRLFFDGISADGADIELLDFQVFAFGHRVNGLLI